jgi:formylglycine-generating enzyme required for sulfatase activity
MSLEDDLRALVDRRQIVVIVGSGVSMATTKAAPTWRHLIQTGAQRCRDLGAAEKWCENVQRLLAEDVENDQLLAAAELVHNKLNKSPGEFARWLRESFETLQVENPDVIKAIADLDIPILTVNYDGLIESVASLRPVTWQDQREVTRVVRGDDRRVLHLHGHWESPDSIVLGVGSYEAVKTSTHTQSVMRAFGISTSLLFVGCGSEGLADPNFGNFLTWLADIDTGAQHEHRHYCLVRTGERLIPIGKVLKLEYGAEYTDLPAFLRRLCPSRPAVTSGGKSLESRSGAPAPKRTESVSAYLARLAVATERLSLLGMGRSLQIDLPIAEAYVPLRSRMVRSMVEKPAERFKEGLADVERDVELGQAFHEMAQLGERGVVLLGEPGSGKTTAARQIAWRLASGASLATDLGLPPNMVPVLLRFRSLGTLAKSTKNGLRHWLFAETESESAPDHLAAPGEELWSGKAGALLWILDGLDEISDTETRKRVSKWIRDALRDRTNDRFLVTSRFAGYFRKGIPLGPGFVELHVRPLDEPQVRQFTHDWFAAAYRKLLGPGKAADERATSDSADLLGILERPDHQTGHIRELSTNPLLLTILCIVFHEERKLPAGRAELYAHCVRVLLEYWRRDLYTPDANTTLKPYNAEAAQAVLARVAWWLHGEQDRTAAPFDELAVEAAKGLADVAESSGLGRDGTAFLERMRDEAGIVAGEGGGRYGFLHLSFQEFLAADHAANEGKATELAPNAGRSWWREVALLSLRRSRPYCETFFRELLASGMVETNADMAERCLTESLYFSAEPFLEVLRAHEAVDTERESPTSSPARIAAVLRLLKDRAEQVPELTRFALALVDSPDRDVSAFAAEILARAGVKHTPPRGTSRVEVDEPTGLVFVDIPAGEFLMGGNGYDDEQPVHRVRISRPFRLAKYPVTNAQYARFLDTLGEKARSARTPIYWGDRRFNQGEQPVVGVSWEDAIAYCSWAGTRLPTEAEWEYACRAGTTTEYYFGQDASRLGENAWYAENSSGQTQPVGAKDPNAWGLHDMLGNVWEWCADWFSADYYKTVKDGGVDPLGPLVASRRVIRGGGWSSPAEFCRSAYRSYWEPGNRLDDVGFRVVQVGS